MKDENAMSLEELKQLQEEKFEVAEDASTVNEGICKECHEKMIKIVENRSIFNGALTFHVIKLKCQQCGKEYLDLDQAETYDLFLTLEKMSKENPLEIIAKKIVA